MVARMLVKMTGQIHLRNKSNSKAHTWLLRLQLKPQAVLANASHCLVTHNRLGKKKRSEITLQPMMANADCQNLYRFQGQSKSVKENHNLNYNRDAPALR